MQPRLLLAAVFLALVPPIPAADLPKPLVDGLTIPTAVAVANGKIYVTAVGEYGKDGDGAVLLIDNGKATPFATGLDDPSRLVAFQQWQFVTDNKRVWRIDPKGKAEVFVAADAFPSRLQGLNDIAVDMESGTLYVCGYGDPEYKSGAVYRITPQRKVSTILDFKPLSEVFVPCALAMDGASHLLVVDWHTGDLHRIKPTNGSTEKIATGLGHSRGMTWDHYGRLFVSDGNGGQVHVIPRPGEKAAVMATGFKFVGGICLAPDGKHILVPNPRAGTLTAVPITVPGAEVNDEPLPLKIAPAFPDLQWADWKPVSDSGKPAPLRPIVLTHAGDESNRVFVATQHGVIHVFPNDQKATKTKVFLDIQSRVAYDDKTNEEGFLGLAFHPKYKKNGEIFVFYTPKKAKLTNVVSRFRVSKDDPDRIDPDSEEELIRFTKPYWNHDGGTVCFGPDGYLYIAHGDGGAGNDPHDNGQNLNSLLGKIHRVDVNHKADGKNYAIPKDNPFVDRKDARPEVWAYGLRNVWRMSFDRKTGQLWAGEVGQNLWEEINLIQRGGNYGWNRREALHPFGVKGVGPNKGMIDPIWEYHHDIGKSITGGHVYRGTRLPELEGHYLYGDYVTTRIWALRYDEKAARVVANRPIPGNRRDILSFGKDEKGELYFMSVAPDGRGISWFVK